MKITLALSKNEKEVISTAVNRIRILLEAENTPLEKTDVKSAIDKLVDSHVIETKHVPGIDRYSFSLTENEFTGVLEVCAEVGISMLHTYVALKGIAMMYFSNMTNITKDLFNINNRVADRLFRKRIKESTNDEIYNEIFSTTACDTAFVFANNAQQVMIDDISNRISTGLLLTSQMAKTYKAMTIIRWKGVKCSYLQGLKMSKISEHEENFISMGRDRVIAYNTFFNTPSEENFISLIDAMSPSM